MTKDQAIAHQQAHLKQWQSVLKPEVFAKLKAWAEAANDGEHDPYYIRRGQSLTEYIQNHLMTREKS
jgi:hypothetical protein